MTAERLLDDAVEALAPLLDVVPLCLSSGPEGSVELSAFWADDPVDVRHHQLDDAQHALDRAGLVVRDARTGQPATARDLASDEPRLLQVLRAVPRLAMSRGEISSPAPRP
ncbi:hypothetical protein ACIBCO_35865 [Streptomyces violascens]|uniref:hypothetical protein n=1 Tax=Streptomyces violascens TaxID=67381 RepID=UPI00379A6333